MTDGAARNRISGPAVVGIVALCNFLQHALTAFRYGPEADEMYYLACSHHLAAGYEDLPPGIAVVMWVVRHTTGTSPFSMHLWAAVLAAMVSLLAGAIAREMGGNRWAQGLAALAPAIAPLIEVWEHILTMNVIEHVLWTAIAYCVVRLVQSGNGRWWLGIGALIGLGLENKYTIVFLILGLLVGLVFTRQRQWFATRWLWSGVAIALLLFAPNLLWQVSHHFTFLHHMHDLRINTGLGHKPPMWMATQIVLLHPLLFPIWLGGAVWAFTRRGERYRLIGWMFVVSVGVMMLTRGREYYTLPAYGMAFAMGAVAWQQWLEPLRRNTARAIVAAYAVLLLAATAFTAPIYLPVLSQSSYLRYVAWMGRFVPAKARAADAERIPIYFQDEMGWQELAATVANVYRSQTPEEQQQTIIWGADYSDAAAMDYYRARYGLPQVISGDVAYWYWGLHGSPAQRAILLGADEQQARQRWKNVQKVARHDSVLPREHYDILLCSDPIKPFSSIWPRMQIW